MGLENEKVNSDFGKIERQGNLATIRMPEGVYTIEYGVHLFSKKVPTEILTRVDGLCLEWANKPVLPEEVNKIFHTNQERYRDYGQIFQLPVFITDCPLPPLFRLEYGVMGAEFMLGGALYRKVREKINEKTNKYSRRRFFRDMGLGSAVFLGLPLFSALTRGLSTVSGMGEEETAQLTKFAQKIHPELNTFTICLRDAVAAQKMNFLLKSGFRHLLAPRGTYHVVLEDMILEGEDARLDFLRRLAPVLLETVIPETFYGIRRFEFKEGQYRLTGEFSEPKLREIINK